MPSFDLDQIATPPDPFLLREVVLAPVEHFRALRDHLDQVLGSGPRYDKAVLYVQGFDGASNALDGFHEWLVARLGAGRSLTWSALVVFDGLGIEPVHYLNHRPSNFNERRSVEDEHLVHHLFDLLDEFLTDGATIV